MIKLLGRKTSGNVQKVLFLLEELGEKYEREDYGRQFGNTTTPEYLKLNPNAKVPTVQVDGLTIWESNTILRYLAARAGQRFYPADPGRRTDVERWMDWLLATLNPLYLYMFREAKKPAGERPADYAAQEKEIAAQLAILDDTLAGRKWLAGDDFSLADIAMGPIVKRCLDFPITLPALPALRAWQERIDARPAFRAATAA
jgi:glutathione S-transferase